MPASLLGQHEAFQLLEPCPGKILTGVIYCSREWRWRCNEGATLALPIRENNCTQKTGRSMSYYARLAIEEFLQDQEDYLLARSRLEKDLPGIPIDEVERRLGLVD